jgi:hypothetical protein
VGFGPHQVFSQRHSHYPAQVETSVPAHAACRVSIPWRHLYSLLLLIF